ncbi:hypothetical protein KIN20_035493 [Parelaphostrongylus tenuis]|uniref:Uncharacterized protein n=1 Tax=Parelaphostrongylus tenuis TaxID=148309 RepID=A0AAD5RBV3_PARTN|nr:hypothetical protein KIN20_035493 [Parelaphostrongylus tenuis]
MNQYGRQSNSDYHNDEQRRRVIHYPELVNSVDRSIDPCNDFYSFVCNGWIKANPIPEQRYLYTQTEMLDEKITEQMKEILMTTAPYPSREFELMTTFYKKCFQNSFDSGTEGIIRMFEKMRKLRMTRSITDWLLAMKTESLFYVLSVSADVYNSTTNILQISPSSSMLSAQTYFDSAYSPEYAATRRLLFKMLAMISAEDTQKEFFSANIIEQTRRVESLLRVDQTLAKIIDETQFNDDIVTVSLAELQKILRSIDWFHYVTTFLPPRLCHTVKRQPFRIAQFSAVQRLEEIMLNIDGQTMSDYLDWKVIFHYGRFLGRRFQLLFEEFKRRLYGVKGGDAANDCVKLTAETYSDIVGKHYLKRHFNFSSVSRMKELIGDIRSAFIELLAENNWMDNRTKKRAREKEFLLEKSIKWEVNEEPASVVVLQTLGRERCILNSYNFHANAIRDFVGYDRRIFNETHQREKYSNLHFTSQNSFYEIVMAIQRWAQERTFDKLDQLNSRDIFDTSAVEVNAFYDINQNQIAINAGILQSPFFNASMPRLMNYAAIGAVTGHEITHGFDHSGASYDKFGNKKNWWDDVTYKNFEIKKQCFEEQYGNITVKKLNVNIDGRRTQDENIADNGAIRAAIRAALRLSERTSERFIIVGLENFTEMQYFFMSYAFMWCGSTREAMLLDLLATDEHAPDMYRVNVVLSNQPEFAQTFGCRRGFNMNPESTCTLW